MAITNEHIESLIDEVILSYQKKYINDYIESEDEEFRHDVLLTKFALMFLDEDIEKAKKSLDELLMFYKALQVPCKTKKFALSNFFKKFDKWVKKHDKEDIDYYDKVKTVYQDTINIFCKEDDTQEDDGFFLLGGDDIKVDKSINGMHYEDEEKIGALEYFEQNPIDKTDMEDIVLSREHLIEILDNHIAYSDEFKDDFSDTLQKLNTTLKYTFSTKEFKDIGDALEHLFVILNDMQEMKEDMQEIFFNILVTFIEDLIKWLDNVFIKQSAVDIHYLDASLLANVAQFGTIFEMDTDTQDESDDDFLF